MAQKVPNRAYNKKGELTLATDGRPSVVKRDYQMSPKPQKALFR
jgi:hypothetical protein